MLQHIMLDYTLLRVSAPVGVRTAHTDWLEVIDTGAPITVPVGEQT